MDVLVERPAALDVHKAQVTALEKEKWTRNIPGMDGALTATQSGEGKTGGAVVLQLHDLRSNVVATVADSETETKLQSTYNSTEFGVPNEGKAPPKYAWLGASGVASEPSFGTGTVTQGGASYVPQIARNLQTAPVVPPGAFPNGQGTGSENTAEIPGWSTALANAESAATLAEYITKQEAEAKEACKRNPEPCLSLTSDPSYEYIYFDEAETFEIINDVEGGEAVKILFFLHKVQSFLEFGPVHWLEKLMGVHTPTDWAYLIAEGVYACGGAFEGEDLLFGSASVAGRCEITIPWTMLKVSVAGLGTIEEIEAPDFFQDPVVSFCSYYAKYCGSYNGKDFVDV
jgi:hypothetical protein